MSEYLRIYPVPNHGVITGSARRLTPEPRPTSWDEIYTSYNHADLFSNYLNGAQINGALIQVMDLTSVSDFNQLQQCVAPDLFCPNKEVLEQLLQRERRLEPHVMGVLLSSDAPGANKMIEPDLIQYVDDVAQFYDGRLYGDPANGVYRSFMWKYLRKYVFH